MWKAGQLLTIDDERKMLIRMLDQFSGEKAACEPNAAADELVKMVERLAHIAARGDAIVDITSIANTAISYIDRAVEILRPRPDPYPDAVQK
jgi:hypothetical protein